MKVSIMVNRNDGRSKVESKSEKHVRWFLAIMFFLQSLMSTLPFYHAIVDEQVVSYSALQMAVRTDGYIGENAAYYAITGGLIVLIPIVAFFFCLLDTRSRVKYFVTGVASVLCAALIAFNHMFSLGAVLTLLVNIVTLFMTSQGFLATTARMKENEKSK